MIVPTLQLRQMGLRDGSDLCKVTEGPAESEAGGTCDQARQSWGTGCGISGLPVRRGEGRREGGEERGEEERRGGEGRVGEGREAMLLDIQVGHMHRPYLAFAPAVPSHRNAPLMSTSLF